MQIKSRVFFIAKSRQVKPKVKTDNLTSSKLKGGSFYDKLCNIVLVTIAGFLGYWNSELLDLLALSRKLGKSNFLVSLTQNDNWPENQNHIMSGAGHEQPQVCFR